MTHQYLVTDNISWTSVLSLKFSSITSRGTNDVGVSVETLGQSHITIQSVRLSENTRLVIVVCIQRGCSEAFTAPKHLQQQ